MKRGDKKPTATVEDYGAFWGMTPDEYDAMAKESDAYMASLPTAEEAYAGMDIPTPEEMIDIPTMAELMAEMEKMERAWRGIEARPGKKKARRGRARCGKV